MVSPHVSYRMMAACSGLLVALASGCGGGGGSGKVYAEKATFSCLTTKQASGGVGELSDTGDNWDYIQNDATGGWISGKINGNDFAMSFGKADEEGRAIEQSYRAIAGGFGVEDAAIVRRDNVVISWTVAPSDESKSTVEDCLQE